MTITIIAAHPEHFLQRPCRFFRCTARVMLAGSASYFKKPQNCRTALHPYAQLDFVNSESLSGSKAKETAGHESEFSEANTHGPSLSGSYFSSSSAPPRSSGTSSFSKSEKYLATVSASSAL